MLRFIKAIFAARKFLYLGSKLKGSIQVLDVSLDSGKNTVELPLTVDTAPDGLHSMFWDDRRGHSLIRGLPITNSHSRSFEVLKNLGIAPEVGDRVWLSGWVGETPEDFDLVGVQEIRLPNGTSSYYFPGGSSWVIHIHGRTATRSETLRNYGAIHALGFTQLSISHETDRRPLGLESSRSYLGAREWQQVELAVSHALANGAKSIVLFGFSLGAMFIGEFLNRSALATNVSALVFDSPLLDFESTLNLQAQQAGLGHAFGSYGLNLIQTSRVFQLFGLGQKDIPTLLRPLDKPGLVLYSAQDGYVSMQRISLLAELNPLFKFVPFPNGRHCRLFNQDPGQYTLEMTSFLEAYRT